MINNSKDVHFVSSHVEVILFFHKYKEDFMYLINYVDDCLYSISLNKLEERFSKAISSQFKPETQGFSH